MVGLIVVIIFLLVLYRIIKKIAGMTAEDCFNSSVGTIAFIGGVVVGAYFSSWYWFWGFLIGMPMILMFANESKRLRPTVAVVMGILLAALWGGLGYGVGLRHFSQNLAFGLTSLGVLVGISLTKSGVSKFGSDDIAAKQTETKV